MSSTDSSQSGSVLRTLLLTDLVSSTRILEEMGDQRAFEVFQKHDRIARDLLATYDGREIDKTDGFLFLFSRPLDAIRYALAYHRALASLSEDVGIELAARAGIHLGEVYVYENSPEDVARGAKPLEVEGLAKPMAARLMSLAQGRQTLLTRGTYDLARRAAVNAGEDTSQLEWRSHGPYTFKGVADPIDVFEVGVSGLSPLTPPPGSAKVRRAVDARGRRMRWTTIAALTVGAVALVVGGFLGLRGGGPVVPQDRETVAVLGFANLSGLAEAAWLDTALTETLAAELASGGAVRTVPGETVARSRRELGLERLSSLAPDTLALLQRRLGADLLVSGSFLRVAGNPMLKLNVQVQEVRDGEQVAAFTGEGAEDGLFELVSTTVAALRRQLGVESDVPETGVLAASFPTSTSATRLYVEGLEALHAFRPQQAADTLMQAAALDPSSPVVHEALAAAWDALGYDERAQEAAATAWELIQANETIGREQRLLVEARYMQSQGSWKHAAQLYGELFAFDPGNLEYGLKLAAAQSSAGQAPEALVALEALRTMPEPVCHDPRIDYQQARACQVLSRHEEQRDAAERAVAKGEVLRSDQLVARGYVLAGEAMYKLGNTEGALHAYDEAGRIWEATGNRSGQADVLNSIAIHAQRMREVARARKLLERALELSRSIGDRGLAARTLGNLAINAHSRGDIDAAADALTEALSLYREVGNRGMAAQTLGTLGRIYAAQGRGGEARSAYEAALEIQRDVGRRGSVAYTLSALGDLALTGGDLEAALERHRGALELRKSLDERENVASSQLSIAQILVELDRPEEAADHARAALLVYAEMERADRQALAHAFLALALEQSGDTTAAESAAERALELAAAGQSRSTERLVAALMAGLRLEQGQAAAAQDLIGRACGADDRKDDYYCLLARLVQARLLVADGSAETASAALDEIETAAKRSGYGLIVRRADALRAAL